MAQTHEVCDYLIDFEGKYGPRYRIYAKNVVTGALRLLTPMLDNGKGFPSKQQEQFFDSKAPYTLFAGSRGPGSRPPSPTTSCTVHILSPAPSRYASAAPWASLRRPSSQR